MTLEQLISNLPDIHKIAPPPYLITRGLASQLQNACRFSKAAVNANQEETYYFGVHETIDEVRFIVMSNTDPKQSVLYVRSEDGQTAEVEVK